MIVGLLVINVNDGPRLTLTCFRTRTNVFACVLDLGSFRKTVTVTKSFKGKNLEGNYSFDRRLMLMKCFDPRRYSRSTKSI